MLAYGVLLVLIGFFALAHPFATALAAGLLLGTSLAFGGAASLIAAFRDAGWRAKTVDLLFGVLILIAAFICLADPFSGAISLAWVIGIIFLITGFYELAAAFRIGSNRISLILLGVVDIALGLWMTIFMGPGAALIALAGVVGIAFVFRGVLLSVAALKLRGLARL